MHNPDAVQLSREAAEAYSRAPNSSDSQGGPVIWIQLREPESDSGFRSELSVEALSQVVPGGSINAVLGGQGVRERRERQLAMLVVVYVTSTTHSFPPISMTYLMQIVVGDPSSPGVAFGMIPSINCP